MVEQRQANGCDLAVTPLDAHSWIISEGSGKGRTHCYLLEGSESAILIDTGLTIIDLLSLTATLTTKPVAVLNTHGHLDHTANNHQFEQIWMHPADDAIWKEHQRADIRYQFMIQRYLDKGISITPEVQEAIRQQAKLPVQACYSPLLDGMRIELGNRSLLIIATPGHTLGSVCILDEQQRSLYTGDTLCEDGVLLHFDHSASIASYLHSLHTLQSMQSRFDRLYPGHQKTPLEPEVLQEYIDCAQLILQDKDNPVISNTAAGIAHRFTYKRATIAYNANKCKEEEHGSIS